MNEKLLERCCGNCFWGLSPIDEEMMRDEYDEEAFDAPKAGDCCIGQVHDKNYFCHHHSYMYDLETKTFYDDSKEEYGYYIVQKYCEHIIKYLKFYKMGDDYFIRAYEIYPVFNNGTMGISFEINKFDNRLLYQLFRYCASVIGERCILNRDNKHEFMSLSCNKACADIKFSKVISGNHDNQFIDIKMDPNDTIGLYELMNTIFENMEIIAPDKGDTEVIKKIRKMNK